jgi:hypothetical protein
MDLSPASYSSTLIHTQERRLTHPSEASQVGPREGFFLIFLSSFLTDSASLLPGSVYFGVASGSFYAISVFLPSEG